MKVIRLFGCLTIIALVFVGYSAIPSLNLHGAAATPGSAFDYVVTILMENNGYCNVVTSCGGAGTYQTSLATTYASAGGNGYSANDHPSEGNYVILIAGNDYGMTSDCGYCPGRSSARNIIDLLEAKGKTWQAWYEDGSGSGTCSANPPRGGDHFAFISFSDVVNNSTRCKNLLSTASSSDTEFLNVLNGTNPPNYLWFTPNDSNNCHDTAMSFCDSYLATLVPRILSSALFTTKNAALFIVYDEGNGSSPSDWVYTAWAGPTVKKSYSGTGSYSHCSYLATIENVWGLSNLGQCDTNASPMTEFFGSTTPLPLSTSFAASTGPTVNTPVTFTATTIGGSAPYTIAWSFGDGSTGTGPVATHTFLTTGSFTVTENATDSSTPPQTMTSSQTIPITPSPPLATSFSISQAPTVNSPVTFTSSTSGGKSPYRITWNFGDGSTGNGTTVAHAYSAAQTFQVSENATDSSSPPQRATSTQQLTVANQPSSGTVFDCTNWDCTNTLSPSGISVASNGTAEIRQSNPSACGWSNSYYDSMLRGSFPWGTTTGTPLPSGVTGVSATVKFLSADLAGSCGVSGSRYHLFIALYYQLGPGVNCPSGGVGANGACWLDTQVRVENIGGVDSSIGTTGTYTSQAIGWDNVTLQLSPGQTGTLDAIVPHQAQQDLITYGVSPSTSYTLMGVEIGTEGYGFNSVNTNWFNVNFAMSNLPTAPSASFTNAPTNPQVGQAVSFTASASGGSSPYSYSWDFGDGAKGNGIAPNHSYASAGTYTVVLTITDSNGLTGSASSLVAVQARQVPDFTVTSNPSSLTVQVGNSASSAIQVLSVNNFSGTVTLTATVSPAGPSASLNSQSLVVASGGLGIANLAISATSLVSPGVYDVSVTASSNSISHTTHVSLTVTTTPPTPDFGLSVSPNTVTVQPDKSAISMITLSSVNGFAGTVSLSVAPVTGLSTSLSQNNVALPNGASRTIMLTVSPVSGVNAGSSMLSLSATSGLLQHSASLTVQVAVPALNNPPALIVPSPQSGTAGSTLRFTVTATDPDPSDVVIITATELPPGATFDATTGQFSWTPAPNQVGSYNVTFIALDNGSPQMSDAKSVQIVIQGVQTPPPAAQPPSGQGACPWCQITHAATTSTWLLVAGATMGFLATVTVVYLRARSRLSQVRTMRRLQRYD